MKRVITELKSVILSRGIEQKRSLEMPMVDEPLFFPSSRYTHGVTKLTYSAPTPLAPLSRGGALGSFATVKWTQGCI